ncbi:MAG: peptide deformylase [Bacteroidetes bacterium]|nr:MAG: peptide deformylase [Bacteroidota bacterium]
MILPIVAYGDSVLKKEAEEIDKDFPDLKKLIEDMYETMYNAQGVGLAAPQIGKSIRLFIVDGSPFADDEDEDEEPDPRAVGMEDFKKVFINPIIEEEEGEEWGFHEGCLSIPKIREEVFRKEKVHISYFNENWEFKEEVYDGYAARIIQHEYDHIDGILFTDHLSPLKRRLLNKKLQNISKGDISVDYKMKFPLVKKGK